MEWERGRAWRRGRGRRREPGLGQEKRERAELGPEAPPSGRAAARPVIRLAVCPRPTQRQWLGESAPCPGLEPTPTREAGDGAGEAAASRPSLPYHPSPLRWTSGPWAPQRQGSGNSPRPARQLGPAPPSLQRPQSSSRPDFRLPLDAPSRFPPSPPPQVWSGVGGRGCVRPAPSPPRPP